MGKKHNNKLKEYFKLKNIRQIVNMKFYRLKNKQMPWGDYGEILFAGYSIKNKKNGVFHVSRTAPFLPCIYRDSREAVLFASETLKIKLMHSSLKGLSFEQAIKAKIVSLDWEKWDLSQEEPFIYPSGDMDAEEYIIHRKHNPKLAEEMGNIWSITFPKIGLVTKGGELIIEELNDFDIFTTEINSDNTFTKDIFVSEKAMQWFVQNGENNLKFEPCTITKCKKKEIEKLKESVSKMHSRQEKLDKLTEKDWQLWHRLINESKKLLTKIDTAKQEKTKIRWKKKSLDNLLKAKDIYPLQDEEEKILEKLLK